MAATNRRSFQWDLWQNPQGLKGSCVVQIWDLEIFCVMVRLLGGLREMRDLSNSGKDMPPHPHDKLHCLFKDWFQLIWLVKQMRQMRWWGPYFSPFSNPKHRISFDMTHYSANLPWHTIQLTCFLHRFPLVSHFCPLFHGCQEMDTYKTRTDSMMTFPEESMPMLTLTGMPSHHRHVFLTAEVLVTMRQGTPWKMGPCIDIPVGSLYENICTCV